MTRNGKIARLPKALREELNRRLDDGETGGELVPWLNERPEVQTMLAEKFGGRPITVQNLSEWKNGGFVDWVARQETMIEAEALDEEAAELREATKGRLCDQMATILASRYAKILVHWRGEVTEDLTRQLRTLHGMSREIVHLRRGEHQRLRQERRERIEEKEREKSNEEVVAHFRRWASSPEVHTLICANCSQPKDRDRGLDGLFGLTTEKAESGESGKAETGTDLEGQTEGEELNRESEQGKAEGGKRESGNEVTVEGQLEEQNRESEQDKAEVGKRESGNEVTVEIHAEGENPTTETSEKAKENEKIQPMIGSRVIPTDSDQTILNEGLTTEIQGDGGPGERSSVDAKMENGG